MAKLLPLVFVVLSAIVVSAEPNIQLSLTDKGLDYVNKVLVKNLVKQLQGIQIPPITIGNQLAISNTKVNTPKQPKSASFGINNGALELELEMSVVVVRGSYVHRGWLWNSRGLLKAELHDLVIKQRLSIGYNSQGQPTAADAGCKTTIKSSSYHFGNSLLLNALVTVAKSFIQPMVERKICEAITDAINKKGKILPTLYPENHKVPAIPCTNISYPITKKPIIEKDYVDFLITGEVQSPCRPSIAYSAVQVLSRFVPSPDRMLSISFADDFINLLLNHYYLADVMNLTSLKAPKLHSNSSSTVQITSAPVVMTASNGSFITFKGTNNVHFKSRLWFQDENKKLSLKLSNLRAYIPTSLSGPRDSKVLQIIQSQIKKIQYKINESLRHVIPLPLIDEMRLLNQKVVYQPGRMILQMDIEV